MKDAQEFIGLLFFSRDFAHKAHLNTDSYAQHGALNAFYEGIIPLADSFAEAWMGRKQEKIGEIPSIDIKTSDPLTTLKKHLDVIQKNRDFIGNDTVLSNIIDEIEALYSSTLYKLKFLK
jgi:hypothetical protein